MMHAPRHAPTGVAVSQTAAARGGFATVQGYRT